MNAQQFLTEYTKILIKSDPMKRQELIAEWAKKLEEEIEKEKKSVDQPQRR